MSLTNEYLQQLKTRTIFIAISISAPQMRLIYEDDGLNSLTKDERLFAAHAGCYAKNDIGNIAKYMGISKIILPGLKGDVAKAQDFMSNINASRKQDQMLEKVDNTAFTKNIVLLKQTRETQFIEDFYTQPIIVLGRPEDLKVVFYTGEINGRADSVCAFTDSSEMEWFYKTQGKVKKEYANYYPFIVSFREGVKYIEQMHNEHACLYLNPGSIEIVGKTFSLIMNQKLLGVAHDYARR